MTFRRGPNRIVVWNAIPTMNLGSSFRSSAHRVRKRCSLPRKKEVISRASLSALRMPSSIVRAKAGASTEVCGALGDLEHAASAFHATITRDSK